MYSTYPNSFIFQIWSESGGSYQQSDVIENIDISGHISTLRSMGYSVSNKKIIWTSGIKSSRLSGKIAQLGETKAIKLIIKNVKI